MQVRHHHRLPSRGPLLRKPFVAALATFASCAACADEPTPWYVGASAAVTHDSNVNRFSDGVNDPDGRGDTYYSAGLLGGFDQSYGRQRFLGTANLTYNKYGHHDSLDNTSYGLSGAWTWASIYNLSGGVNVNANQSLAQLNGNTTVPTTQRNLLKTDQIGGNVVWGGTGILSAQAAYTHSRVSYSSSNLADPDSSADTASLGAFYAVGPSVTAGLAYRFTRTDTPLYVVGTISDGRNIDLSVDWHYTVQTGFYARLSFTQQSNPGGASQDYSGLTGAVSANYAPTAKLSFSASYNRDAGTNGTFFNVPITSSTTNPATGTTNPATGTTTTTTTTGTGVTTSLYQSSTVANTFAITGNYAATAKIGVNASYTYRNANIGNAGVGQSGSYTDKLQIAKLGATWAIERSVALGCNLSREKRDAESSPVYAYTANVIGCSAQVSFR